MSRVVTYSHFWAASYSCNTSKNPRILWNREVYFCIYMYDSSTLVPILSHNSPVQPVPSHLNNNPMSTLMCSTWFPSFIFPTKSLNGYFSSNKRASCSVNLISLFNTIIIVFVEKYELWSSTLWNFLRSSITFSPIDYISCLYKREDKITAIYILDSNMEDKILWTEL